MLSNQRHLQGLRLTPTAAASLVSRLPARSTALAKRQHGQPVVCRATQSGVRQSVREAQEPQQESLSITEWDLIRLRQARQRLATGGQGKIVPFRRPVRRPTDTAREAQVAVIEPELIERSAVATPEVEPQPSVFETTSSDSASDWKMVVGLSALLAMICSVDRAAMSVALGPMGEQFMWSDSVKGTISSSFFLGYTLTNFIGGYAATRYNPKTILVAGAIVWGVFTVLTPTMADNLPALLATRAAMGVGEGVALPAISNLFQKWVPTAKLSSSLSVAFSGGPVGVITALLVAPPLIQSLGWQSVFWLFGSSGLVWAACAWPSIPDDPPRLPALADAKVQSQPPREDEQIKLSDVPWGEFVRNPSLWALLACHCSCQCGPLICLSWMPIFYAQEFGLDVGHSAALSMLPWGLNILCTNLGGLLSDKAIQEWGADRTLTRKLIQGIASVGPAACLFALAADQGEGHSMVMSAALLSAALGLGGFCSGGMGSNHQDIAPRWAGILFGVTNASASITGVASIMATGFLLDATHSWGLVFAMAASVYVAGYAGFAAFGSAEKQFE